MVFAINSDQFHCNEGCYKKICYPSITDALTDDKYHCVCKTNDPLNPLKCGERSLTIHGQICFNICSLGFIVLLILGFLQAFLIDNYQKENE